MKKIVFSILAALGMTLSGYAQTTADSVFVVKDGKVVGAYEVGKEVDYLTFHRPAQSLTNYVQVGDEQTELHGAYVTSSYGYTYVLCTPSTEDQTYDDITNGDCNYLFVCIPEGKVGQDVTLSTEEDYAQGYWMTPDYNYDAGTNNYDMADDGYTEGVIHVDLTDDEVTVSLTFTPEEGGKTFTAYYKGAYAKEAEITQFFTFDGEEKECKAAFYSYNEDDATVDLYYTSGDITDAKRLEDCYQYVHLQVPFSALWNGEFDISGTTEFKLDIVDNVNEVTYSLSQGNIGTATGVISVAMNSTDSYTTTIDLTGIEAAHSLSVSYDGEHLPYDLSTANSYQLQNEDATELKSAVLTYADDKYTIYLSKQEGVTTVEGMADADITLVVPVSLVDGDTYGFSGDSPRDQISVSYDGVTYNQANTTLGGDDKLAIGGNVACSATTSTITVDFNVYNIYKYSNANLTGHYEGAMTWAE